MAHDHHPLPLPERIIAVYWPKKELIIAAVVGSFALTALACRALRQGLAVFCALSLALLIAWAGFFVFSLGVLLAALELI